MPRPTLFDHPKFHRLVHLLGLPEPHVLGHLEYLWRVGYSTGNPVIGDAINVELLAKWTGQRGALVAALADPAVRFLDTLPDGQYAIHDLHENAPDYVQQRTARESERKKPKTCEQCGDRFHSSDKRAIYCGDSCRNAAWREKKKNCNGPATAGNAKRRTATQNNAKEADRDGTPAPTPTPAPSHTPTPGTIPPNPPEGGLPATPAGELGTLWAFHCTRKIRGVVADRAEDKTPEFAEMLRRGADFEALKAAIVDPNRDRNEHLWQFRQRILPPATGPPAAKPVRELNVKALIEANRRARHAPDP
jgi:hypothetical protein